MAVVLVTFTGSLVLCGQLQSLKLPLFSVFLADTLLGRTSYKI
jgi:hypothetical protein